MRRSALASAVLVIVAIGCNDLRDFRGSWSGPRVGDAEPLRVGVALDATAALVLDAVDRNGLSGSLAVDGLIAGAPIASVPGAEADVLAGMSFDGSPVRVYLGFVAIDDGAGEAIAVVSLYDDDRIEVRLVRGAPSPIYAIFALDRL